MLSLARFLYFAAAFAFAIFSCLRLIDVSSFA